MGAVLDLLVQRESGPSRLVIDTADGVLTIVWPHSVDKHELAKARALSSSREPWRVVLERVSDVVDCQGATVTGPPQ